MSKEVLSHIITGDSGLGGVASELLLMMSGEQKC